MQMDISQSRIWYISLKWCVLVGIMAVVLGCFVVRGCCRVLCHPHLKLYAMNWGVIMSTFIIHLLRFVSVISTVASRGWLEKRVFSFYYLVLFSFCSRKSHWFRLVSYYRWTNWVKYIYIYIHEFSREFLRHTPHPVCMDVLWAASLKLPKRCLFFFFSRVLKPQLFFQNVFIRLDMIKNYTCNHTRKYIFIYMCIYIYIHTYIYTISTHRRLYLNYFKHSTYHIDLQVGCNPQKWNFRII